MRIFFLLCLLVTGWGCQATPTSTNPSESQTAVLNSPEIAALDDQRDAFLSAPELADRMERLLDLEQQALQLAVDEPLKLGSIGSAILDAYPGSQTGHYAMSRFYEHVESLDAKASHDAELERLQAYMGIDGADGSLRAPYKVMTIYDAHTFARTNGAQPVGSIYQIPDLAAFHLLLISKPDDSGLKSTHFDLSHVVQAFNAADADADQQADAVHPAAGAHNPWQLLQLLAARMDSAAQTAIGRYLIQREKYKEAISWLQVASRSGNVLANASLARIYLLQAETTDDEAQRQELRELAMENHLHAIAMGSTEAMYTLANLYINDYYGEENRSAAIPLLRQAGDLGHAESLLYLGYLYNAGREVDRDVARAAEYFARAAALNNPQAILSYGRFLSGMEEVTVDGEDANHQIHQRLRDLAAADEPEAMVILGNLHARGIATAASNREALRWYKKAVRAAPDNADIVNEVAWTLTVSDIAGLKRARYAKRIMDSLMNGDATARVQPEYLDTWAAAHAASGDFDRAIALQEQAIEQATSQEREDVLDILRGHLELFKAGATITEKAP
jgi:TPR repeat protein